MIKKLIPIIALTFSIGAWADLDNVCYVELKNDGDLFGEHIQLIKENCERNNILVVVGSTQETAANIKALYCRYDRNVHVDTYGYDGKYRISCVLYDNEHRNIIQFDN